MSDNLQVAIGALIIALVLFAFWKHGRGNPASTGSLARQIHGQGTKLASLEGKLEGCATRGALDLLAEQVRSLEAHSASSGEVLALEAKINGMSQTVTAQLAAVERSAVRTEQAVRRIEDYFIERGIKGS